MANTKPGTDDLEKEFKDTIHRYFDEKINNELNTNNVLEVGNNLGQLLKDSEKDIVKIITPRAVNKWF